MEVARPIVVIDDDKDDSDIVVELLSDLQEHEIICFNNGRKAFEYLSTTDDIPFFILCDINLPIMNGFHLLKSINEIESIKEKSIPFIFLSTTAEQDFIKQAYLRYVQGFFVKPSNDSDFKNLLSVIINYWERCRYPND